MGSIPHIGDDEKLELAKGFAIINGHERASVEGAKVDLVTRYLERRHLNYTHEAALYELNGILQEWYPGSPICWPDTRPNPNPGPAPEPGPTPSPLPQLDPALAARKIPWGRQLECNGRSFIFSGDGAAQLPVGLHMGDLIGQWTTVPGRRDLLRQALDSAYLAGYSWLRSWLNVDPNPWWESNGIARSWNPITTPGFDEAYDGLLYELEQRQLLLHLVPGGLDILPKAEYRRMFRWMRDRVAGAPHRYALIEACNEAEITARPWNSAELAELLEPFRGLGVLLAVSAGEGTEDRRFLHGLTPAWMQFCYYHSYRGGRLHDKYRHHFSFMQHEAGEDPVRRLAWSGEPTGPGRRVSATDNKEELEQVHGAVSALHVQSAMCRHLTTYFCSPGVIYDEPFANQRGFWETPRAIARLPQDVHTWHLTHGGKPDAFFRATTTPQHGIVRADQAHGPVGQIACTFYSERASGDWCDVPMTGAVEGQIFDGAGAELWSGRADGRISLPPFPLAFFVGRRV